VSTALTFKEHEIVPFDNKDGKIWFTGEQLAKLLGYADMRQVNKIYQRHKDEFTDTMTTVSKVTFYEKLMSCTDLNSDVRLFSSRGAHLIGMMSRTKVAKELRKWLLDLIEKESNYRKTTQNH
jgi:prophage antirepressor-like protein